MIKVLGAVIVGSCARYGSGKRKHGTSVSPERQASGMIASKPVPAGVAVHTNQQSEPIW